MSGERALKPVVMWTDAEGRYRAEAAAGSYRVTIEKAGLVDSGGTTVAAGGLIAVRAGETSSLDSTMRRAGAIEGRFLSHNGLPVPRLDVVAARVDDAGNSAAESRAITDDLGRFRLHTLRPGRYRVSAVPPPPASGERLYLPGTTTPTEAAVIDVRSGLTSGPFDVTVPRAESHLLAGLDTAPAVNHATLTGLSSVRGRVIRASTGEPMGDARVDVLTTHLEVRASGWTNADGTFLIERLPAGDYMLRAQAPGFINQNANPSFPAGTGVRVILEDGRPSAPLTIPVFRSSAIEAVVLDEFGDPAPGIQVQVLVHRYLNGVPHVGPSPPFEATTDDRGRLRINGLFPNDFYLVALPEPFGTSGGSFALTYFPGTTSADAALPLTISSERDLLGLTFRLGSSTPSTLHGIVADAEGRPLSKATIAIMPAPDPDVVPAILARATTDGEGRFEVSPLPAGRYVVQAGGRGLFGIDTFIASSEPGASKVLRLKPAATVRGRVRFDGETGPKTSEPGMSLWLTPLGPLAGSIGPRVSASVGADGAFELKGVVGKSTIGLIRGDGWMISRITHRGRDITDVPLDFQDGDLSELEVVVTNRLGTLTGTVRTASGAPVPNATVVAYGADGTSWPYLSRTTRGARTDANGTFSIAAILPGRYTVAAVSSWTGNNTVLDPPAISWLKPAGIPVTVTAGPTSRVELRPVR